uniref:HTH CENPB-type domain-containing protein n=1 Tax=Anolis carolinensis TaxID=28377 RepID=A0A803TM56_ANOCA
MFEMERLLTVWMEEQNQCHLPLSPSLVQEKARSLYVDLRAARPAKEGDFNGEFLASRSWFNRFKERAKLHQIKVQNGAVSAEVKSLGDGYQGGFARHTQQKSLTRKLWINDDTAVFSFLSKVYLRTEIHKTIHSSHAGTHGKGQK